MKVLLHCHQVYDFPKFAGRSKLDGVLWIGSFLVSTLQNLFFSSSLMLMLIKLEFLWRRETQHNDTQQNNKKGATTLSITIFSTTMLSITK
jgi:hypothetical protein